MRIESLHHTILRAASLLAPGDQRTGWLEEWRSELWYVSRDEAAAFCMGAFRDALWLRRNNVRPAAGPRVPLESPTACLAFLVALAAATTVIAGLLPAPQTMTPLPHLSASELAMGCIVMLLPSSLILPVTHLVMGRPATQRHPMPWMSWLRLGVFLALKIILIQPVMLCGFVLMCRWGGPLPVAPLGIFASWILAIRWVLLDQRRRCPVCLRLLTNAVRIGDPSHTFLEWYGAESVCSRGHGLLHVPEISASYSGEQHWLKLDGSWKGLFSTTAGIRR